MINQKACETCDHWQRFDMCLGHCVHHDIEYYDDAVCENWTPRHGEWISTALAKPDDKELVAIRHAGKIELAIYSVSRKAFITEKGWLRSHEYCIKWWMRFPEVLDDSL